MVCGLLRFISDGIAIVVMEKRLLLLAAFRGCGLFHGLDKALGIDMITLIFFLLSEQHKKLTVVCRLSVEKHTNIIVLVGHITSTAALRLPFPRWKASPLRLSDP